MTDAPVIMTRREAVKRGLHTYYTGKPCKNGHDSPRYVSHYHCMQCARDGSMSFYNDNKESISTWRKAYNRRDRKKTNARNYVRNKRVRHATLPGFYKVLKQIHYNCPEGYVVDHIEPIKGKDRSGLNVPWNLQYLPYLENAKKGNKTDYVCEGAISIDWKQYV